MPEFSPASASNLMSCDSRLVRLFCEVVKHFDCTVISGHRARAEQNEYYRTGRSQLQYPDSKHNSYPSLAVDVAPYPINWADLDRFYFFGGFVMGVAAKIGVHVRFGGDWSMDTQVNDQTFNDLVHFELVDSVPGGEVLSPHDDIDTP